MSGLVDLFYPGNKNREARVNELCSDCSHWQNEVAQQKVELQKLLEEDIPKSITVIYNHYQRPTELVKLALPDGEVIGEVASVLASIAGIGGAMYGMNVAWKSWLLKNGRIGEAALIKLLGYPKWFKFARAGVAIVVTFAIDSIVSSIVGSIQRDELRKAIRECIEPRKNIYKAYLINKTLINDLSSIETILKINTTLEPSIVENTIKNIIANTQKTIDALTDQEVYRLLAEWDKNRNSWTKEDGTNVSLSTRAVQSDDMQGNSVEYLDGSLVAASGKASVFLIQNGVRHYIPNPNVFTNLFSYWEAIHYLEENVVESIPLGKEISLDACLIKGDQADSTYFYSNNAKSRIRSIGDFNHVGFHWKKIKVLPQSEVDKIDLASDFVVGNW